MILLKLILLFNLILSLPCEKNHTIVKRSLLFPRATVLQFTYGLSVPLILRSRSINFSLCYQINYDLPYNITNFQPKIVQAKAKDGIDLSRELFYKYIISFLDSFGLNGEQCLYLLICEISEFPMHLQQKENLLEEIVHYVFTPSLEFSNSSGFFSDNLLKAESIGNNNGKCRNVYSECFVSIVDLFTSKYII